VPSQTNVTVAKDPQTNQTVFIKTQPQTHFPGTTILPA